MQSQEPVLLHASAGTETRTTSSGVSWPTLVLMSSAKITSVRLVLIKESRAAVCKGIILEDWVFLGNDCLLCTSSYVALRKAVHRRESSEATQSTICQWELRLRCLKSNGDYATPTSAMTNSNLTVFRRMQVKLHGLIGLNF